MSGPDGTKRQRTDGFPPDSNHPALPVRSSAGPPEPSAELPPELAPPSTAAGTDEEVRAVLARLLASQEQLVADVSLLQQTVSAILSMLNQTPPPSSYPDYYYQQQQPQQSHRHQGPPRPASVAPSRPRSAMAQPYSPTRTLGGVPPTLANIVSPQVQPADQPPPGASSLPKQPYPYGWERARATSGSDAGSTAAEGAAGTSALRQPTHRRPVYEYHPADTLSPAATYYTAAPQRLGATWSTQLQPPDSHPPPPLPPPQPPQGFAVPRLQPPATSAFSSHGRTQLHHPHQHQQRTSQQPQPQHGPIAKPATPQSAGPAMPPAYHSDAHFGKHSHNAPQPMPQPLPRFPHQSHGQYGSPAASAGPASPRRMQAPTHAEQSLALPPIMRSPAVARSHDESEQYSPVSVTRKAGGGVQYYPPPSLAAAGMAADATAAAKPLPAAGAMPESPMAGGSTALRSHHHHHHHQLAAMSGGASSSRGYGGSVSDAMHKVEKNRFQANIRAFVDQHFMTAANLRWDYQQSFKAPHNAEATQRMVDAFRAANGNTYERVEHGLGVYFSSLKAKHRTTEDKAMLKQQRDRRRARRIKKAAGRRKVFDRAQYPFLPSDVDTQTCFMPLAMSPEHTDDDGEVKVGALPWRLDMFAKLFHHLDTLRPKRTPRHVHPNLRDLSEPAPDIPRFMIDHAYMAMDRTRRGHSHTNDTDPDPDPDDDDDDDDDDGGGGGGGHAADMEDDVDMDSSSDDGRAPSASAMSL